MDDMRELIDAAAFDRALTLLAVLGPLLGLAVGGAVAAVRKHPPLPLLVKGLLAGLTGTLAWGLWRWFEWTVRYEPAPDPADDYFGLERVDVLLMNVAVFTLVGLILGWVLRRVWPIHEPVAEE